MKNEIQVFDYNSNKVRTMQRGGEPWFVLKDVCQVLGMDTSKLKQVSDRLDADEKGRCQIPTPGGAQETWIINESGLYNVILRSDKPEAKPFRKWVTSEVLPTIRKTGSYSVKQMTEYQKRTLAVQTARILRETAKGYQGTTYGQIIDAYVTKELTGEFLLPLPKLEEKTYSATDIGKMFGVSARKIGDLAKTNGLKTEEYGEWFKDKAANCDKEVQSFRYFESAVPVFEALLGGE